MHYIETAVGKDDPLALAPPRGERRDEFMSAEDFLVHEPSYSFEPRKIMSLPWGEEACRSRGNRLVSAEFIVGVTGHD